MGERKFKIGDKVRILDRTEKKHWNTDGEMDWTIGEIGTIVNISIGYTDLMRYTVKFLLNEEEWLYNKEDLSFLLEEKEENIIDELTLTNLTQKQKKQIIELAKKFEQELEKFKLESETDKLDYNNDWKVYNHNREVGETYLQSIEIATDLFSLGLTAHTKEEAEKIRRRLIVEKELRGWAKKCKEPLRKDDPEVEKYMIAYEAISNEVYARAYFSHLFGEILFSEQKVAKQAIESIGQERLIRDYFGIEK